MQEFLAEEIINIVHYHLALELCEQIFFFFFGELKI